MTESERPYDPPPEDEAPPGAEPAPPEADGPLTPEEADDEADPPPPDATEARFQGG